MATYSNSWWQSMMANLKNGNSWWKYNSWWQPIMMAACPMHVQICGCIWKFLYEPSWDPELKLSVNMHHCQDRWGIWPGEPWLSDRPALCPLPYHLIWGYLLVLMVSIVLWSGPNLKAKILTYLWISHAKMWCPVTVKNCQNCQKLFAFEEWAPLSLWVSVHAVKLCKCSSKC